MKAVVETFPMRRFQGSLSVAFLVLASCGPTDSSGGLEKVDIAVVDAPESLTAKAGDKLFKMTLSKTAKSYALTDISVDVGFPGGSRTAVEFTHEDANGNGKLDQGESLNCTEPPVNLFDTTSVGKTATVSFAERRDGTMFQVGTANWTVTN